MRPTMELWQGSSMYDEILYEVQDPVALITLNRPAALNAWTATMDAQVRDAVARACADRSAVGIVITGAGKGFCAGADMNMLQGLSSGAAGNMAEDPQARNETDFDGRFTWLMGTDKPVIAAVNGAVAGMAYALALCCDIRVASPDALFVTSFAQRGLIAEWGLGWLLPRLVRPSVALDLLFSSRRVRGEEAMQLGLVDYLTDPDDLVPFCRRYIENLAATCSPSSIATMKHQVYEHLHRGLGAAEADAQRLMLATFGTPQFTEGVTSFVEKRPPQFPRLPL